MADNTLVKDAGNNNKTFDTKDIGGGVQRTRVEVASGPAGALTDVGDSTAVTKVITDTNGTLLGYLRGVIYFLVNRLAALGQAVMAASHPVTIASDQSAIPIEGTVLYGGPAFTQAVTPTSSADMTSLTDLTPAPSSGEHTVIESVSISAASDMIVTLKEETTNTVIKRFNLTSGGDLNAEWNPANGLRLPNADKKLRAISDTADQVDITVISHSAA
jgi:hypothetical protein